MPVPQALPQPPQLLLSVVTSTHEPEQAIRPAWQVLPHVPPLQTWPALQGAQPPQCAGLDTVETHAPPQKDW
jgi:hypothetical protein